MLIEQFFDTDTFTFTYLIADTDTGDAALIDSVNTHIEYYLEILNTKKLTLRYVLDTHTHADHISANGPLRDRTGCITYIGKESLSTCIDKTFAHGDSIALGKLNINILHTPGHTDDSYCFYVKHVQHGYLFTGDTLLINGSGRTDFQNGDAHMQYHSLFHSLLNYPDNTVVYPGHDYNGNMQSTIGKEKKNNPRLQLKDASSYIEFMNNLQLPNPKHMDIAIPANQACGKLN